MAFKSNVDLIHPRNKFTPACHYSKIHDYVITGRSLNGTTIFVNYMQCGCTKTAVRV